MRLAFALVLVGCYRDPPPAPPRPPTLSPPLAKWLHFELPEQLQAMEVRGEQIFLLTASDVLIVRTLDGRQLHRLALDLDSLPGPHHVALTAFSQRPYGIAPVSDRIAIAYGPGFAVGYDYVAGKRLWQRSGIYTGPPIELVNGALHVDTDHADIEAELVHGKPTQTWLDIATGRVTRRLRHLKPDATPEPEHVDITYESYQEFRDHPSLVARVRHMEGHYDRERVWVHRVDPPHPTAAVCRPACDENVNVKMFLRHDELVFAQPDHETIEVLDHDTGETIAKIPLHASQGLVHVRADHGLVWLELHDMPASKDDRRLLALDDKFRIVTDLSTHETTCREQWTWLQTDGTSVVAHRIAAAGACVTAIETFRR